MEITEASTLFRKDLASGEMNIIIYVLLAVINYKLPPNNCCPTLYDKKHKIANNKLDPLQELNQIMEQFMIQPV